MTKSKKQLVAKTLDQLQAIILPSCETWGLYWSDYEDEMRLLLEESTDKYIIKHQEDKHPPLRQHQVTILQCPQSVNPPPPAPSKPTPAPSKPPPSVKLPDIQPPLKCSTLPDTKFSLPDIIPNNSYCHITPTSERMNSLKVTITEVQTIECPPEKPKPKLIDNAQHPSLHPVLLSKDSPQNIQGNFENIIKKSENKWGWMKEDDYTVNRTKQRLSFYW